MADFGKDGWGSGSPENFSGDYFVPGSPVEGWTINWKEGSTSYSRQNKGLVDSGTGTVMSQSSAEITSDNNFQSSIWVGQHGNLQVSKVTQVRTLCTRALNHVFFRVFRRDSICDAL